MLLENQYDQLIEEFFEHPDFFNGIFQQLICEKRYGGINFPTEWTLLTWYGPTYEAKDGSNWIAKYWTDRKEDIYTITDGKKC